MCFEIDKLDVNDTYVRIESSNLNEWGGVQWKSYLGTMSSCQWYMRDSGWTQISKKWSLATIKRLEFPRFQNKNANSFWCWSSAHATLRYRYWWHLRRTRFSVKARENISCLNLDIRLIRVICISLSSYWRLTLPQVQDQIIRKIRSSNSLVRSWCRLSEIICRSLFRRSESHTTRFAFFFFPSLTQ